MQTGKKGIKKACLWCRSRLQNGRLQHLLHGTTTLGWRVET